MNTIRGTRGVTFASPTLGTNAYKRLGIRTSDISRNLFLPNQAPGTTSLTTGGKTVRSEFFGFWGQLSIIESGDAKQFFETLLEQLRELDMRLLAPGATPGVQVLINGIPAQSIYNTIAFMLCHTGIRLDNDKLALAFNAYSDPSRDPIRAYDSTAFKNLMRLMALRTQAETSDEAIISPLVSSATSLVPKDVRLVEWQRLSTIDETDIQCSEHAFVYPYLCSLVQERGYEALQLVLKALVDKAHSLPQLARMSLPMAEQSLFAVLHTMRVFIQQPSLPNPDLLDRAIRVLRLFTLWHQPWGKLTEQMIALLKQEMITPGHCRRQFIYNESLVVDYGQSSPSAPFRHVKPIFYLYDTMDSSSLPLLNILDPVSLQSQHLVRPQVTIVDPSAGQNPPSAVLTQILLHAFDSAIPELGFKADEVVAIQNLTQEKILPFTQRLTTLEQKYKAAVDLGTWAPEQLEHDYSQLKADLLKIAKQSSGPAMFTINFQHEGPQLPPPIPTIEHIRVPVELKAKTMEHEGNSQPGYPAAAMYDKLQQILQAYAPDPSLKFDRSNENGPKLREIRFVLIGNDRLLQHVVTAYYSLLSNSPSTFNGLDVKFFLAPCTKNHFANYLAQQDLWYFRHIYSPFRCPFPFVVPFLRDDEIEVKTNNESGLIGSVSSYYRDAVAQYVREAHHTYKTIVFKLEGRSDLASPEPSDVIPFLQRVEIGINPAIEEFKAKSGPGAAASLKYEDILKDKTFIYLPPELSIKYCKIDLAGSPKPELVDDAIPYQSFLLSHVPRKSDIGNIPDPSSKGLELLAQPAPKIDKAKLKKNSLFYDPRQHVAEVTCTSNIPFKVLCDGVIHGPYRSVRISIAQTKSDGRIAQFPVQTFFPIQPAP